PGLREGRRWIETMTNRLSPTNALADANIDRQKAERIATEIFDAIHDNVATKQDVQNVEAALKTEIAVVGAEMREVERRLEARIDRVVVRLGFLIVVLAGVMLAAIGYRPHG
ncbi:MAG: hypothetical protein ACREE2_17490, partial [Stellaceae bacterium]